MEGELVTDEEEEVQDQEESEDSVMTLRFDGGESDPDYVEFSISEARLRLGSAYTLEWLISPDDLTEMSHREHYTLFEAQEEVATERILLYGDGSIEFYSRDGSRVTRTESDVIIEDSMQRLSIVYGTSADRRKVFVDGDLKEIHEDYTPLYSHIDNTADLRLGVDDNNENPFAGVMGDFRLFANDEPKSEEWISEHADKDLTDREYYESEDFVIYFRFDNEDNMSQVKNYTSYSVESEIRGAEYVEYTPSR